MNREIRVLGIVLVVLYSALFVQLNNLQVFSAKRLNEHPANTRSVVADFSRPRGSIFSADGFVLATSEPSDDDFERQRRYPEGALFAQITGYFSFTFGTEGIERTYNDALTGRDAGPVRLDNLDDLLLDQPRTGDVTLTVSRAIQEVAVNSLGGRKGSVVALDPRTGAVLAMASLPTYDPSPLAGHNLASVRTAWEGLIADPDQPLRPRSYRDRYFPGSSFKVVTAAAGLTSGVATATRPSYPRLTQLPLPQASAPLGNFGGSSCGGTLPEALRVSCNTTFAQLGLDLGGPRLQAGAEAFGFNSPPPIDLPFPAPSAFPDARAFDRDKPALAKSAIGQQDVSATPLQMALVAAGVANGGVVMTPHLLADVRDNEGAVVTEFKPRPWKEAVTPDVARTLNDMMVGVVEAGSGTRARIPGVKVAGKTGTAQTGLGRSHVWFMAFAPAEAPRVAVAVMLENVSNSSDATGGLLAAPIAKAVMERALQAPSGPLSGQAPTQGL